FARRLESRPNVRVFWGLTTDIVGQTDVIGRIEKNDLRDSSQRISGGFLIEKDAMHYTLETSYATTSIWGNTGRDVFSVRPGFVWQVPRRYTGNSSGQWLIGAATPVSFGPDGTNIGISVKLQMNFDFKRKPDHEELKQPAAIAMAYRRR
ncbi:MAG: hypothetical protein O7C75_15950, partial [Verrucomicrobia bacterium]|nr:hypothetical protein [Verrucomicrobiota bacterium]